MPRHLKVETSWSCDVCGGMAMGVYEGSDDPNAIVDWAQAGHDRISPNCPHKFKTVEVSPMDSEDRKKGKGRREE